MRREPRPIEDVDLSDPDTFVRGYPHEAFARWRVESPVFWHPTRVKGFWVLSRYQDVWDVSLDQRTFSSSRQGSIPREWENGDELDGQRALVINTAPPLHTKYRRLVNLGFSPKMVNRLEVHIRDLARRIVDAIATRGECDFVADVAAELPLQVIVEMIGVPVED